MKTKKFQYDYYTVTLPSDLVQVDSFKYWHQLMCMAAINAAEDSAKQWCVPCEWQAKLVDGGPDSFEAVFKVRRKRYARPYETQRPSAARP